MAQYGNALVKKAKTTSEQPCTFTANGVEVKLTPATVKNYLVSGNAERITDQEVVMFINLCKYNSLNPWLREAYCIKYGSSPATMVVGKETFQKRADADPNYNGEQAGVIVETADGQIERREGCLVLENEQLLGGWAKVYRKDRTRPSYEEVKLAEYDTGKSLWKGKKATMIRKVALVHALREAFPSTFGTLYDESEVPVRVDAEGTARELDDAAPSPRWTRIRDTAAQADALAVEDADEPADDPFAGGEDA